MTWPGWDSIESTKRIASGIEGTTLVFWVLLVLLEIVARSWKRFAKVFDILALIAFALAVSGEVVGHKYNSRKEALHDVRERELSASYDQKLQKANEDARKARENVQQSFDEAQKAAALSKEAQEQAKAAQDEAATLKRQQAHRSLSEQQKTELLSLLKPEGPQELYFISAPDAESQHFADEVSAVLNAAGWKTSGAPYNWGNVQHYPVGVEIVVADPKTAPRGASVLQSSLKKVGIEAYGMPFVMVPPGKFALFIGLKPETK